MESSREWAAQEVTKVMTKSGVDEVSIKTTASFFDHKVFSNMYAGPVSDFIKEGDLTVKPRLRVGYVDFPLAQMFFFTSDSNLVSDMFHKSYIVGMGVNDREVRIVCMSGAFDLIKRSGSRVPLYEAAYELMPQDKLKFTGWRKR